LRSLHCTPTALKCLVMLICQFQANVDGYVSVIFSLSKSILIDKTSFDVNGVGRRATLTSAHLTRTTQFCVALMSLVDEAPDSCINVINESGYDIGL
jgi:hypothetical protein